MGWKIIIAPSAQADLADIVRYVAQHNSDAAARLGYELITRAENLANFPEIGRTVPEFQQPNNTHFWLYYLFVHIIKYVSRDI